MLSPLQLTTACRLVNSKCANTDLSPPHLWKGGSSASWTPPPQKGVSFRGVPQAPRNSPCPETRPPTSPPHTKLPLLSALLPTWAAVLELRPNPCPFQLVSQWVRPLGGTAETGGQRKGEAGLFFPSLSALSGVSSSGFNSIQRDTLWLQPPTWPLPGLW